MGPGQSRGKSSSLRVGLSLLVAFKRYFQYKTSETQQQQKKKKKNQRRKGRSDLELFIYLFISLNTVCCTHGVTGHFKKAAAGGVLN